MPTHSAKDMTFWEHLDALRTSLIRAGAAVLLYGVVIFCFKDLLFDIILAPSRPDFVTYQLFAHTGSYLPIDAANGQFRVQLISVGLAEQFLIHVRTALFAGAVLASPLVLYFLFGFISPALREDERRYAFRVTCVGSVMALLGLAFGYFVAFPFTFLFLGTYQVAPYVQNTVTLQSYMDGFLMLNATLAIIFEIPCVCWFLGKLGLLSPAMMRAYRKYAIVVILIIAAIITPTSDAFTLTLVSLPIWLLYEVSILIVRRTGNYRAA